MVVDQRGLVRALAQTLAKYENVAWQKHMLKKENKIAYMQYINSQKAV